MHSAKDKRETKEPIEAGFWDCG